MSTADRLKEYLEYKKIAPFRAENECGLSSSALSKALPNPKTGQVAKSIGSDNLEKILNTYTDLSSEWLLRGTGNMIVGEGMNQEQLFKSIGLPANSREIIQIWMKYMDFNNQMQNIYQQLIKNI